MRLADRLSAFNEKPPGPAAGVGVAGEVDFGYGEVGAARLFSEVGTVLKSRMCGGWMVVFRGFRPLAQPPATYL
jgi:hypothetical protein